MTATPSLEAQIAVSLKRRRRFILANTFLSAPPLVPEIRLHLATEAHELWHRTETELASSGLPPPFWAFAWAGGQALARHILDHPDLVKGAYVLDFASGSGLVAIAAAKAGAAKVDAVDIDPFSGTAVALNAEQNTVAIAVFDEDRIGVPIRADVLLAGDVFFDRDMTARLRPWFDGMCERGVQIFVGDPGRTYLPTDRLAQLASYEVPTSPALEDAAVKTTSVGSWRIDKVTVEGECA